MRPVPTLLPIAALAVVACGSDGSGISIDGAWARASAEGQTSGAIYLEMTADDADTLLSASVPASVAAEVQIHEVVMADSVDTDHGGETDTEGGMDTHGDHGGSDPQMRMEEVVDGLALPPGETVTFEPGGRHVMLVDLADPLEIGEEIELTLDFEHADDTTVTVEVAESAP